MTTNAASLSQEQSQALKERTGDLSSNEQRIIQSIKQLYTCKPVSTTYDVYDEKAVFHDPIGIAEGRASVKNQFDALAKLCAKGEIPKFRVLETPSTVAPSTLLIDQDVDYHLKEEGAPFKTINSLLTIETNSQGKITRHTEEWDHKPEKTGADGFVGWWSEIRKKLSATGVDLVSKS